jgi:hypothetical protein
MLPELSTWERRWAPYDEDLYDRVMAWVPPGSVVLDIGAGDLRLARRLAGRARIVYAIELQPALLAEEALPENLHILCGDARMLPFPTGIDVAILLMRHCTHFALYRDKLVAAGCRSLITNARWGVDAERVDLTRPGRPYEATAWGWYACRCGATGFRPGPPEQLTRLVLETINEVTSCPECTHHGWNSRRLS